LDPSQRRPRWLPRLRRRLRWLPRLRRRPRRPHPSRHLSRHL